MPCQCEQCSDTPAPTCTEEYRRITEAKHVCRMKDRPARQNYIAEIARIRGNAAAIQLMDDIKIQWEGKLQEK